MRYLIVFTLCIIAVSALNLEQEWRNFKAKYNKKYKDNTPIGKQKKQNFAKNLNLIEAHNRKYAAEMKKRRPAITYKLGIGPYADLSLPEFRKKFKSNRQLQHQKQGKQCKLNKKKRQGYSRRGPPVTGQHRDGSIEGIAPRKWNWNNRVTLNPVQDQGDSNSCWAYATAGLLEAYYIIKHNRTIKLSEQELIECVKGKGVRTTSCNGGIAWEALDYICFNSIAPINLYPKTFTPGECYAQTLAEKSKMPYIAGYRHLDLENPDEEELKKIIAFKGPVLTSMPTAPAMHHYRRDSGVFNDPECNKLESDHYVLIIGYGVEPNGQEYWLIKNSWSNRWGIDGYMKLARNKNNLCKIASEVFYPLY